MQDGQVDPNYSRPRRKRAKSGRGANVPTIKQVAAHAGVSTATVSRVLAGLDGVSPDLVERVQEAVRVLDYHPNLVARGLRVRTTLIVGLLISDIQNPFFTSVVRGVEDVLMGAGYTLMLCNTDDKIERQRHYLRILRGEGAAGVIITPSSVDSQDYRPFLGEGIPMVAIDRTLSGLDVDMVTVANREGARAAVAHLSALGHRRIAIIGGPTYATTAMERRAGYEAALAEARIERDAGLMEAADYGQVGGYSAMLRLLDLECPPTAVFVANNLMTLGALQALHGRRHRIPADMAVVGFDDMPWAASLHPPLTSVAQPTYEIGATAARLLLDRIREPERPAQHVVLQTRLIVRASCGASPISSASVPRLTS